MDPTEPFNRQVYGGVAILFAVLCGFFSMIWATSNDAGVPADLMVKTMAIATFIGFIVFISIVLVGIAMEIFRGFKK